MRAGSSPHVPPMARRVCAAVLIGAAALAYECHDEYPAYQDWGTCICNNVSKCLTPAPGSPEEHCCQVSIHTGREIDWPPPGRCDCVCKYKDVCMPPPAPPPCSQPATFSEWLDMHRAEAIVVLASGAADLGMAVIVRCVLHASLGSVINVIFTITNIATRMLFVVQMLRAGASLSGDPACGQVEGSGRYAAAQIAILLAAHVSGFGVIIPVLRNQHAVAEDDPGKALLDVHALHERTGIYTVLLVLGSANLQVLNLLPWRETHFDGLPSARMLLFTYASVLFGELPQLCLQTTYIILESAHADPTISAISLGCTFLSLAYRLMKRWLKLLSGRVLTRQLRLQDAATTRGMNEALVDGEHRITSPYM